MPIYAPPARGVVWAAQNGAPGGTADDTSALLSLINAVPEGTSIVLNSAVYSIQPDALNWNRHGITLAGMNGSPFNGNSAKAFPVLRCLTDGGYFVKIGAVANYAGSGLIYGAGIRGVLLDGNNKKWTDAGLVMEGITRPNFQDVLFQRFGANSSGRYTKTARFRLVWDWYAPDIMGRHLYNPDAPLFEFDDISIDAPGNCNNVRFIGGHFEQFDGRLFSSTPDSNLDSCTWTHSKFEMGVGIVTGSTNYVWDLDGAQACDITDNKINKFSSDRFAAIARFGATTASSGNTMRGNIYQTVSCREIDNGTGAGLTEVYDNKQVNAVGAMGMTNVSQYAMRYEAPASMQAAGTSGTDGVSFGARRQLMTTGAGWVPVHYLDPNIGTAFVGDTTSVSNEKSVYRVTTTTQGTVLFGLPQKLVRGSPVDIKIYVRVKKTATGTNGRLQLNVNGTTIQGADLADNTAWQVTAFTLTASTHLAGLDTSVDSGDRFRVEYGGTNAQPLDVDAVMIVKQLTAS